MLKRQNNAELLIGLPPEASDNEAIKHNYHSSKEDTKMKNTMNKELTLVQLDLVNGGSVVEVYCDSEILHAAGYMDYSVSKCDTLFFWGKTSAKVDEGWAKAGITCVSSYSDDNKYFYQGRQISCDEARSIVKGIKGPQIGH